MPKSDLKRSMKLDKPETTLVGDVLSVVQVHISVYPEPVVHIGYGISTANVPAAKAQTLPVPVGELATKAPGAGAKLEQAIQDVIDGAYAFLREAGLVGPGVRT